MKLPEDFEGKRLIGMGRLYAVPGVEFGIHKEQVKAHVEHSIWKGVSEDCRGCEAARLDVLMDYERDMVKFKLGCKRDQTSGRCDRDHDYNLREFVIDRDHSFDMRSDPFAPASVHLPQTSFSEVILERQAGKSEAVEMTKQQTSEIRPDFGSW